MQIKPSLKKKTNSLPSHSKRLCASKKLFHIFDHQYRPTVFADPVGLLCPPLGTPVLGGKCPLAAPVPLGSGFTELDPLGVGKGAAPDCVE